MRVDVESHRRRVTCLPRHVDDAAAFLDQKGYEAVAQIVGPAVINSSCQQCRVPCRLVPRVPARVPPGTAIGAREDQGAIVWRWQPRSMLAQVFSEWPKEPNRSGAAGLRLLQPASSIGGLVDQESSVADVAPGERESLLRAKPGVREKTDDSRVGLTSGRPRAARRIFSTPSGARGKTNLRLVRRGFGTSVTGFKAMRRHCNIYTDGSSLPTPRRGGLAVLFVLINANGEEEDYEPLLTGYAAATNQQMELQACIEGLKLATAQRPYFGRSRFRKIVIKSDSTYVVENYGSARYAWPQNEWKTKSGRPVNNAKQWLELVRLIKRSKGQNKPVRLEWVKGKKSPRTKAVDKGAKRSAKASRSNLQLTNAEVRRKLTDQPLEIGSVGWKGS